MINIGLHFHLEVSSKIEEAGVPSDFTASLILVPRKKLTVCFCSVHLQSYVCVQLCTDFEHKLLHRTCVLAVHKWSWSSCNVNRNRLVCFLNYCTISPKLDVLKKTVFLMSTWIVSSLELERLGATWHAWSGALGGCSHVLWSQLWKLPLLLLDWTLCMVLVYLYNCFHCAACGILVPWPGIELATPSLEGWSLNLWTTRELLAQGFNVPNHL